MNLLMFKQKFHLQQWPNASHNGQIKTRIQCKLWMSNTRIWITKYCSKLYLLKCFHSWEVFFVEQKTEEMRSAKIQGAWDVLFWCTCFAQFWWISKSMTENSAQGSKRQHDKKNENEKLCFRGRYHWHNIDFNIKQIRRIYGNKKKTSVSIFPHLAYHFCNPLNSKMLPKTTADSKAHTVYNVDST